MRGAVLPATARSLGEARGALVGFPDRFAPAEGGSPGPGGWVRLRVGTRGATAGGGTAPPDAARPARRRQLCSGGRRASWGAPDASPRRTELPPESSSAFAGRALAGAGTRLPRCGRPSRRFQPACAVRGAQARRASRLGSCPHLDAPVTVKQSQPSSPCREPDLLPPLPRPA